MAVPTVGVRAAVGTALAAVETALVVEVTVGGERVVVKEEVGRVMARVAVAGKAERVVVRAERRNTRTRCTERRHCRFRRHYLRRRSVTNEKIRTTRYENLRTTSGNPLPMRLEAECGWRR